MVWIAFFFKQKTAYEIRISDWSSDVCSSDLEDRDDAREWADPAQALSARAFPAPAHGLGTGNGTDDREDCVGEYILRRTACPLDHGEPDTVAVFEPVLRQAGLAQKVIERLRRRAGARAFQLLADRGGRLGKIAGDQREAARGRPDGKVADIDASPRHLGAEQLFQLGARAGLHPGGDFLAAQFEKEVGAPVGCAGSKPGAHSVHPGWFAVQRSDWLSIQALQLPFARSRTRAM